jgi:hypothetical protein
MQATQLFDTLWIQKCNVGMGLRSEILLVDLAQSEAHRWTVVQLPTARDGKVACGDCGIWCPNLNNLMTAHLPSARHQQRRRWLAGPPPATISPGATVGKLVSRGLLSCSRMCGTASSHRATGFAQLW